MRFTHLLFTYLLLICLLLSFFASCSEGYEHTAPAIRDKDSVPVMVTYGVNTLISDSGVIKYRVVAEEWEVNENKNPSRWIFNKGILLTQFDLTKHVVGYIQSDTAVYFDKDRRWKLNGHVRILTSQGVEFQTNNLFWDEQNHLIWSNTYSHLKTPDKELEGNWFKSDEQMTNYEIRQIKGWSIIDKREFPSGGDQSAIQSTLNIDTVRHNKLKGPVIKR